MTTSSVEIQVAVVNAVRDMAVKGADRLRREDGEIGSQLLLMAMLVVIAAAAVTAFKGPLNDLIGKITGGLGTSVE